MTGARAQSVIQSTLTNIQAGLMGQIGPGNQVESPSLAGGTQRRRRPAREARWIAPSPYLSRSLSMTAAALRRRVKPVSLPSKIVSCRAGSAKPLTPMPIRRTRLPGCQTCLNKGPARGEDLVIQLDGARQRGLTCDGVERRPAHLDLDRAGGQAVAAQALADLFGQLEQGPVQPGFVSDVAGEGRLGRDGFGLVFAVDGPIVLAVGGSAHLPTVFAEAPDQILGGPVGQIADGLHAHRANSRIRRQSSGSRNVGTNRKIWVNLSRSSFD